MGMRYLVPGAVIGLAGLYDTQEAIAMPKGAKSPYRLPIARGGAGASDAGPSQANGPAAAGASQANGPAAAGASQAAVTVDARPRLLSDFEMCFKSQAEKQARSASLYTRESTLPPPPEGSEWFPMLFQGDAAHAQRNAYNKRWRDDAVAARVDARRASFASQPRPLDGKLLVATRPDLLEPELEGKLEGSCTWHKLSDLDKKKAMFEEAKNLPLVKNVRAPTCLSNMHPDIVPLP
jgi:hypothetical protein